MVETSVARNYNMFIDKHRKLLESFNSNINEYLKKDYVKNATKKFDEFKNRVPARSFNIFRLVSDIYYRENFHSDILKAFLDPTEMHDEGNNYLFQFIKYLNGTLPAPLNINSDHYQHAEVKRELGRIDILISDPVSKHAIIIENKINKAGDQIRQIPNYHDYLVSQGYIVDIVIYLLLNYHAKPNTNTWSDADRHLILPKLIVISASNDTSQDLVVGWLQQCVNVSQNLENQFVINQYIHLLQKLGELAMNKQIMKNFYGQLLDNNDYETALSVRDMINQLSHYRIERLVDTYKGNTHPFEGAWNWQNKAAVLSGARYNGKSYKIDIVPGERNYAVQFVENVTEQVTIKQIISDLNYEEFFTPIGDRLQRTFSFPEQEGDLYLFVKEFQQKFAQLIEQKSNTEESKIA
ncbi:PD-(D/E)XK nuclease family protein [Mucilaginibacter sp.]